MLPIISLGKIFDIKTSESETQFAVVVGSGKRKIGLLIDEVIGQQEIVVNISRVSAGLPVPLKLAGMR